MYRCRELAFGNSSIHGGATQCSDANHVSHAKERGCADSLWNKLASVNVVFELHDRSFMGAVLSSRALFEM